MRLQGLYHRRCLPKVVMEYMCRQLCIVWTVAMPELLSGLVLGEEFEMAIGTMSGLRLTSIGLFLKRL